MDNAPFEILGNVKNCVYLKNLRRPKFPIPVEGIITHGTIVRQAAK